MSGFIDGAALPLIWVLAFVLIGAGLMALGFWAYPKLRDGRQGYPYEKEIEALLLPWIYNAIISAYRMSEFAVDEVQQRMRGADKAAIAGALYDMLPDRIGNIKISIVKMAVSKASFAALVEAAFVEFDEFFEGKETEFEELLEEWLDYNRPRG